MTTEQINSINISFRSLPEEIKDWLTSKEAGDMMLEIIQQFVLSHNQQLAAPFLLMRLVTQNLPPEQFKSTLAEVLAIDHALAEKITDALAEKILAPIKQPLQSAGVNIDLLKFDTPRQSELNAPQAPTPEKIAANQTPQNPQSQSNAQNSAPNIQNKPFVLHEEPSFSRGAENNILNTKPSFIFNPAETMNAPRESLPAKVIIERVVHYNQLRTPFNQTSIPKLDSRKEIKPPQTKWFI